MPAMRFWPRNPPPHPASYVAVLQTTSRRILAGWLAASSVLVSPLAPPTPVTRLRLCSLNKALPLIKSHSRSVRVCVCVCVRAGLALQTGLELAIGLCSHNVLGTYNIHGLTHAQLACSLGTDCNMRVNAHSAYACASVCVTEKVSVCERVFAFVAKTHLENLCRRHCCKSPTHLNCANGRTAL